MSYTAMFVNMRVILKLDNGNLRGELNCDLFEEPHKFTNFMSMIEA